MLGLRHLSGSAIALSGILSHGCAPPIPVGDFQSPDPASRIYAAVGVAQAYERDGKQPDRRILEDLIQMLPSADPAERLVAADTLRLVTGVDLGYRASDPLPLRVAATDRWVRWAEALPATGTAGGQG